MTNIKIMMMNMMNNPLDAMLILSIILMYMLILGSTVTYIATSYLKKLAMREGLIEDNKIKQDEGIYWKRNDSGNEVSDIKNLALDWIADCSFLYNLIEYETRRRFFYNVDMTEKMTSGEAYTVTSGMLDKVHDEVLRRVYHGLTNTYKTQLSKYMTDFALMNHISSKVSDLLEELRIIKEKEMSQFNNTNSNPDDMYMSYTLKDITSAKYDKVKILNNYKFNNNNIKK